MVHYANHPEKAICLDVETTGVDPGTAEIVQLSIIDYNGNTLFNEYIKPDKAKIWPGAEAVHHISPLKVLNKPHLSFYHEKLKKIFDSAELIIAYNGDHYDIPIIARYGFPELREKQSYDVMLEFAPIYGEWNDYHGSYTWQKLNVCADYYGYKGEDNYHDSLEDVRATLFCYKKMTSDQDNSSPIEDDTCFDRDDLNVDGITSEYESSFDFEELARKIYQIEEELAEKYCEISASFMDRKTAMNAVSKPKISVFIYGFILSCDKLREYNMLDQTNRERIMDAFGNYNQEVEIDLAKYTNPGLAEAWKYDSIINFGNLNVFAQFFDKTEGIVNNFLRIERNKMNIFKKHNKIDIDYDSIVKKLAKIYKRAEGDMAKELSRELGVDKTNNQVQGYSRAYSKTLFNYFAILLYDAMLENRGNLPTFDEEVDLVIDRLSDSRPAPKDVLRNCINKRDELRPDLEKMFREDNTPRSLSSALSDAESLIDDFFI